MKRAARCALAILAACGGAQQAPPAYGEALFAVDTDLAVPQLASRLRVDVFAEDGTWIESRDIGRSDPRDWPATFSVYADDDTREHRALVRLRAYPEGSTRSYAGERFRPIAPYEPPRVARDLADLCANAPPLAVGDRVTLRRGATPITDVVPGVPCTSATLSGSVAARVTITQPGTYRFDVASAAPWFTTPSLFLRSRCDDVASQIACDLEPPSNGALTSSGHLPRFDAKLDPGTYFLVTGGAQANWPADLTLEFLPVDTPLPPPPSSPPPSQSAPSTPRLVRDGADVTPETEPLPTASVDRLVVVRLVPGARGRVRVTLGGECAGTQAKLGADPTKPDLATAQTCVDRAGVLAPLVESPLEADLTRPTTSVQGAFGTGEACDGSQPANAEVVCVPGGAFLFGSLLDSPFLGKGDVIRTTPERIARMHRFWMDRHEVTVARFRDAVARGLPAAGLATNDAPFPNPLPPPSLAAPTQWCTYSSKPLDREDDPMNCIAWPTARAFCVMQGGDLPTETQWEYAGTAAGRPFKTRYAWGDDDPSCDRAVLSRGSAPYLQDPTCAAKGIGPAPVTQGDGEDVTPLGIVNLTGAMTEWMRDAGEPYDGDCWAGAGLDMPACLVDDAPYHVMRGGAWDVGATILTGRGALGGGIPGGDPSTQLPPSFEHGFRCVYDHPVP
ncbi:MAG TPA: SUMF1/EgtB/PvdO family nonheme iron enzyme [Labilithrix sp.]